MNNVKNNSYMFALRCIKSEHPKTLVITNLFIIVSIYAYGFWIFERKVGEASKFHLEHYERDIWLVFVTIFTIGYGDYYPWTIFGKCTGVLSVFTGVYLTSLLVIVTFNLLKFDPSEERAYTLLDRLNGWNDIEQAAGNLLLQSFRF